jgi:hypothetical protein
LIAFTICVAVMIVFFEDDEALPLFKSLNALTFGEPAIDERDIEV